MTRRMQIVILLLLTAAIYLATAGWPALLDNAHAGESSAC
jgi:hypothetical protein